MCARAPCVSVRVALAVGCETGVFSLLLRPLCCPAGPGCFSLCLRLAREAASAMGLQERLLCLLHLLSADLSPPPPCCRPSLTCLSQLHGSGWFQSSCQPGGLSLGLALDCFPGISSSFTRGCRFCVSFPPFQWCLITPPPPLSHRPTSSLPILGLVFPPSDGHSSPGLGSSFL